MARNIVVGRLDNDVAGMGAAGPAGEAIEIWQALSLFEQGLQPRCKRELAVV